MDTIKSGRPLASLGLLAALTLVYIVFRTIYRLFFHSLSHIPGPWYAAVSSLYEFYWDCIQNGRYYHRIDEMHERYGNNTNSQKEKERKSMSWKTDRLKGQSSESTPGRSTSKTRTLSTRCGQTTRSRKNIATIGALEHMMLWSQRLPLPYTVTGEKQWPRIFRRPTSLS